MRVAYLAGLVLLLVSGSALAGPVIPIVLGAAGSFLATSLGFTGFAALAFGQGEISGLVHHADMRGACQFKATPDDGPLQRGDDGNDHREHRSRDADQFGAANPGIGLQPDQTHRDLVVTEPESPHRLR